MKWRAINPYCIESEVGYRISKAFSRRLWVYTAWTPNKTAIKYFFGSKDGGEEAKRECEKHYENERTKQAT